ncbi:DUF881 domain-containing protein [Janibacter sp. GXQ6167]|uniref:DUF881 domain-containing protein n=1 Tax=Janibacter sp. GXQ6167 TaxID=3240791 RepID=UPI00352411CA
MKSEGRHVDPDQEPDRPRMLRAWLTHRPTKWSSLVPVIALAAGLLFAVSGTTARGTDLRSEATDLPDVIRSRTHDNARAGVQVKVLQSEVEALSKRAAPDSKQVSALNDKISAVGPNAGSVPIEGPSLTVTLDDAHLSSDTIPEGFTVDDVVVHQQDVQAVVNALWRGGAEGMMIMDQRVISTSAVRCVGNTLILQGRVYSPPFTITAIGDQASMQQALDADPGVKIYRDYVKAVGLGYEVSAADKTLLPAYEGTMSLKYAAPPEQP